MRVIGGEFRSRLLRGVPGLDTRPTPDRLRESLFNVLIPRIAGATDRKSTRLNSSHIQKSRMPSSA